MLASHVTRTRARPLALASLLLIGVAACKDTEITDVPVAISSIQVNQTSLSLKVGQSTSLSAVARSASGKSLTARSIQWSTSNSSVVMVSPAGQVTAVGVGSAMLTASAESKSATVSVTVDYGNFTVNVDNLLLSPTRITLNGTIVGTVPAASSSSFTIPGAATVTMSWQLVRPTTTTGVPIGDEVGGDFSPLNAGTNTAFDYEIDNEVGTSTYMAVSITNNGLVRLLVAVNFGLTSENRCSCLAPTGGIKTYFGYYKLFSNSNVRGYAEGSNYTGTYVFWDGTQLNNGIQTGSGAVDLINNNTPTGPALVPIRGDNAAATATTARPLNRNVHRDDHLPGASG